MICPNCGRETSGKFCPFCGVKLAAEPEAPQINILDASPDPFHNPSELPPQASVFSQPQEPTPVYGQPQEPTPVYGQPQEPTPVYDQPQEAVYDYGRPREAAPVYDRPQSRDDFSQTTPIAARIYPGVPVGDGSVAHSEASQLIRKLASSPILLLGALFFTLSVLFPSYLNVKNLLENYRVLTSGSGSLKVDFIANIAGGAGIVLLNFLVMIGLWGVFCSGANKGREQMGTGGLSILSVVSIVMLMVLSLLAGVVAVMLVQNNSSEEYSSLFRSTFYWIDDTLYNFGVVFPNLDVDPLTYRNIFLGSILVVLVLTIVYYGRIIKSIGTARLVIRTGGADDRVSVFVALVTALLAAFSVYRGVWSFVKGDGSLEAILMGVSLCLSAVAGLCFSVLLFKFRSGMRGLGVRNGIPQDTL